MLHFVFILLIFLNFAQPNLSTISSEFILDEMNTFIIKFEEDLQKFAFKVGKIVGKKPLQEMGNPFVEALIHKEFLDEFKEVMKNVKEYLTKENGNFEEIAAELKKLRLSEEKLKALKKLKEEISKGGNIPGEISEEIPKIPAEITGEILNEKRLELVDQLISLHGSLKNFVDKTKLELQIGIPQKNFNEFGKTIQENAKKLEGIFGELFEENKEKGFHQILDIILKKKRQLRTILVKGMPKNNQGIVDEKLFETLKMNQKILLEALSKENPLLEKVILNECPENLPSGVDEFVLHYEKIRLGIDRAVDGMPKLIVNEPFFQSKLQNYVHLRQFQWLNNANSEMFHRISLLGGNDPKLVEDYHLADILYLAEYIKEKLNENKIVDIKGEMAQEWEEIILNISKYLLSISERLEKIRKIDEAISRIIDPKEVKGKVLRMIEAKTVPENIGIYFYSEYKEMKNEEIANKKLMVEKQIEKEEKIPLRKTMSGGQNDEKLMPENIEKPKTWPQSGKSKKITLANKPEIVTESSSSKKNGKMMMEKTENIPGNSKGTKIEKALKSKDDDVVESEEIVLKSGDIAASKLSPQGKNIVKLGSIKNLKDKIEEVEGEEIIWKSGEKVVSSDSPKKKGKNVEKNAVTSKEQSSAEEILWGSNPSKSKHLPM